ncbi:hypothetical protein GGH12_002424 [Coemansia sp. RSA 1822]|nr:hypothetical protein LPJ76_002020 [Coemansia sp. RSA 638]KAJ2119932.1 hypothetical protein IW147_005479 [Coemansia sp. RSA 720]KAJ2563728.1 hypothetical protein GGH12_002424 [Coemansia sp. RSA 1822]
MASYSMYSRPTIVALPSAPPTPERFRRRSHTSSSGTTLVQDMAFHFDPPSHLPSHADDFDVTLFDNTPPQPFSHDINNAWFGLPYAQRCGTGQSGNTYTRLQRSQTVGNVLVRRSHIRRAGRVQVDVKRSSTLEKAATKMADLLRFRNRAANNRQPNSPHSTFGSDKVGRYNQPQPQQTFALKQILRAPHLSAKHAKHATMPAAVSAFAAAGMETWPGMHEKRAVDVQNFCPADKSSRSSSDRTANKGSTNIFCVNGVATLSTHKPQLVTIESVGGKFTIVPSHA